MILALLHINQVKHKLQLIRYVVDLQGYRTAVNLQLCGCHSIFKQKKSNLKIQRY